MNSSVAVIEASKLLEVEREGRRRWRSRVRLRTSRIHTAAGHSGAARSRARPDPADRIEDAAPAHQRSEGIRRQRSGARATGGFAE